MLIKTCANCGVKTTDVKAYVGKDYFPLCQDCWKKFFKGEITLETLEQKAVENE